MFSWVLWRAAELQNLLELVANEVAAEACQKDSGLLRYHATTVAHIELVQAAQAAA